MYDTTQADQQRARTWRVVTPCAYPPISVEEFKTHSRIDTDDDLASIDAALRAATEYVEAEAWRALMPARFELRLDAWPAGRVVLLPNPPLAGVVSVGWVDAAGAAGTMATTDYMADTFSEPGRVVLATGASWPAVTLAPVGGVRVVFDAGYAAALPETPTLVQITAARLAIPERLRHAVRLLAAHYYENREQVAIGSGLSAVQLPAGVSALIASDRAMRF